MECPGAIFKTQHQWHYMWQPFFDYQPRDLVILQQTGNQTFVFTINNDGGGRVVTSHLLTRLLSVSLVLCLSMENQ